MTTYPHCAYCKKPFENRSKVQLRRCCSRSCKTLWWKQHPPKFKKRFLLPLYQRFLKHVNKTESCWLWTHFTDKDGYGKVDLIGGNERYAHRLAWVLAFGSIGNNLYCLHHCDIRNCVRPSHLFLGTAKDNYRDSANKQRNIIGERNASSKFSDKDIRHIRDSYTGSYGQLKKWTEEYHVSRHTIWCILTRRTWKHLL